MTHVAEISAPEGLDCGPQNPDISGAQEDRTNPDISGDENEEGPGPQLEEVQPGQDQQQDDSDGAWTLQFHGAQNEEELA